MPLSKGIEMDPDSWTPARGWAIALGRAGIGSAVLLAVFAGMLYFVWPIDQRLPPHWAIIALIFIVSAAAGYPMGYMIARKLVESCGLAGKSVLLPVLTLQIVASVLAYQLVLTWKGEWGICTWVLAVGLGFWSAAAVVKTIALE